MFHAVAEAINNDSDREIVSFGSLRGVTAAAITVNNVTTDFSRMRLNKDSWTPAITFSMFPGTRAGTYYKSISPRRFQRV